MVSVEEPFAGLFTQGMVTHETFKSAEGKWLSPSEVDHRTEGAAKGFFEIATGGPVQVGGVEKMSKSKKNTVAPEDIFDQYGVDAARLFVLSDSPPERDVQWTEGGVEGAWRFVNRVWNEVEAAMEAPDAGPAPDQADQAAQLARDVHKLIKAATEGLDGFRFNSAVAQFYAFLNTLKARQAAGKAARIEALTAFVRLISPFTPHLAEACWERLGGAGLVVDAAWPAFDPALATDEALVLPVQINGKRRGEIRAPAGAPEAEVRRIALDDAGVQKHLDGVTVRKVIVVQDRIVNIVAG
jgi:leucyl-tRNA synthetase